MKKILVFFTVIVAYTMMMSCSSEEDVEYSDEAKKVVNMLSEAKPIQLTPAQRQFANDNNSFTLNFLKTVNETDRSGKSFIYSPLSITYVLGMVNDAATGQAEQELEQTLGFHEGGIQAVNEYCKNLIDNLPKVDEKVTLNIANAIFVSKEYTLKEQFKKDMKEYYDAQAETLDFNSPQTLGHINDWCKNKTNGMIPTILDEVNPNMMSYLLNAIYFKADWTSKFDSKNTKTEIFTTEKGSTKLPLMHQTVLTKYGKNDVCSAVEMPYGNGYWKMTILLPEEGKTTDDIINSMKEVSWGKENLLGTMDAYEVDLKLPRFETSSDTDELKGDAEEDTDDPHNKGLISLMKKMGLRLAFDPSSEEICNMCQVPVYIDMMRQKAKIMVNEEGSEAAAVTVAGMMEKSTAGPVEYPMATFHADHPFVYLITEGSSGVILFVGRFAGE